MLTGECARDGNPAPGGSYLCDPCVERLVVGLRAVPGVLADLDVTLTRQDRIGERERSGSTEQPLPYSHAASEARTALVRALWSAWTSAGRSGPPSPVRPFIWALWLAAHPYRLARASTAADDVDALLDAIWQAREVVDRPPVLAYAGICWAPAPNGGQCAAELYGAPGSGVVVCSECGARHDADRRRAWLLEQVDDQLAHASQLALAVSGLGVEVKVSRIYNWAHRGRIVAHGVDHKGRPLYRVGDVLEELRAEITKRKTSA